jgi:glucose/arabinose dehydrogenase
MAQHGSWNRSGKVGYRLVVAKLAGNAVVSVAPFAEGWLQNGQAWGRPVDVLELHDGSVLVSDDKANVVYRITYSGRK